VLGIRSAKSGILKTRQLAKKKKLKATRRLEMKPPVKCFNKETSHDSRMMMKRRRRRMTPVVPIAVT